MAYVVRRGRLYFEPRTGNGPCSRRAVGEDYRRHVRFEGMQEGCTLHVTKGRFNDGRRWPGKVEQAMRLPTTKLPRAEPNMARIRRNDASRWAAARVDAPEVMTRQRRRALERRGRG